MWWLPQGLHDWSHFVQRNVYACALGKPHGFHFGHAIGTVNLGNCETRKSSNPLKAVGTIQCSQSSWIAARAVGALIPLSFEMNEMNE